MTIPDLIDESLRNIGAKPAAIEAARRLSLALHCDTEEKKQVTLRELTEQEIEHYRKMILVFFAAVLLDPELRDRLHKEITEKLERN